MFKRILKGILCVVIGCTVCGCSKEKKTADTLDFKALEYSGVSDIEKTNFVEDARLFESINKLSVESQANALNSKERSVVILKYLGDVYQLASTRVSNDLENIYIYSENYQNYIAILQAYTEYYARDITYISENIQNDWFNVDRQPVFIVLSDLEKFWIAINEQLDDKE